MIIFLSLSMWKSYLPSCVARPCGINAPANAYLTKIYFSSVVIAKDRDQRYSIPINPRCGDAVDG